MSGSDLTPPPAPKGVTYRGLTEIVGLGLSAFLMTSVLIVFALKGLPVPTSLLDVDVVIVLVIVARSAKSAQDRDAASTNIDAAAHAATNVAAEVRKTLEEHKAQIGTFAQLLTQFVPAAAPVLAQLGYTPPPPPPAPPAPTSPTPPTPPTEAKP